MERPSDLVLLGKVTKPHGIRGEVKVYPYSGEPENFLQYAQILLAPDEGTTPVRCKVVRARVQKNSVLIQLENSSTRNDAEALVGFLVYIHRDELPKAGRDEFYLRDLEGRQMVTEEGRVIGTITGILSVTGQDIARVRDGDQEYMIPLVSEFLLSLEDDRVQVSLPPGLLEINS